MGELKSKRNRQIETSFVLKYFEVFYCAVLQEKEAIISGSWLKDSKISKDNVGVNDATYVRKAQEMLENFYLLLSTQASEASLFGGEFAANYYKEAQFAMAALADEVFLYLDWPGRKFWEENLLESRLFGTHGAGYLFFENLDNFLATRDPLRKDLAELYLLALGLGFLGKYRGIDDHGQLNAYKKQLYVFINHRESRLFDNTELLFPESYMYTLEHGEVKTIDTLKTWMFGSTFVFIIILFASFFLWYKITAEPSDMIKRILDISGRL